MTCLVASVWIWAQDEKRPAYPSFDYLAARTHEIQPHRTGIRLQGVPDGSHVLPLTLTVSPAGVVLDVKADGDAVALKFWPQLEAEVRAWRFIPFEESGNAVTATVQEFIALFPPERLPKNHVVPPDLRPDSKIEIKLQRTECFGTCPAYSVTVSTDGIVFDGRRYVLAFGRHTDSVNADEVRKLAKRFVDADFYSMDAVYKAGVTDLSDSVISITIDGQTKEVNDYVGGWVGMPGVIGDLENAIDTLARTERWIEGSKGLVEALQAEEFNFQTYEAQVILKEAMHLGRNGTLRELLAAGVPLTPLPAPTPAGPYGASPSAKDGWLTAAAGNPAALDALLAAGASKNDQRDKDLALADAAGYGIVAAARALIAYGANPNADLETGSVLIRAASSGNPEMVREVLRYRPIWSCETTTAKLPCSPRENRRAGTKRERGWNACAFSRRPAPM